MRLEEMLAAMRDAGWTVGSHNDYHEDGKLHTFWLFTHVKSGRFVKGEAPTDHEAVKIAVRAVGIKKFCESYIQFCESYIQRRAEIVDATEKTKLSRKTAKKAKKS